jgi:hypothetical protein
MNVFYPIPGPWQTPGVPGGYYWKYKRKSK